MKAYKFKVRTSQRILHSFERTLETCRELYNAGLQERRDAWKLNQVSINYHAQAIQLPDIKAVREDVDALYSQIPQDVLRRLSKAFDAFFHRAKRGEKAGFPRFKGKRRYDSFTYPQSGFRLDGDKLTLSKIGTARVRLSRPVDGRIKTCTIKHEVDGWYVILIAEENQCRYLTKTGDTVGIDVGLESFATLSNGEQFENPQYLRKAERRLKTAQRSVSRKKRGSKNRRKAVRLVALQHLRVKRQRLDFFHKLSLQLIREYDAIAVENLNIAGMVKNHHLAKSISDAAWGIFLSVLECKAADAGRRVVRVRAAFTSQDCSECGERRVKSLGVREHRCLTCGYVAHRDVNAAKNIRGRADRLVMSKATLASDPRIPAL